MEQKVKLCRPISESCTGQHICRGIFLLSPYYCGLRCHRLPSSFCLFCVPENTKYYKRKSGGTIWMSFTLDPQSCNVYFFPESKMSMIKMVSSGRLTGDVPSSGCSYMELEQPCAIANTYIQSTCKGQFEFRDQNDNNALVVTLDVERK